MLLFKCKNLIVCFVTDASALVWTGVQFFYCFYSWVNFASEAFVNTGLVALLLAPDIDLFAEVFVAWLQVVVGDKGFVKAVFKQFYLVLVFFHVGGSGTGTESFFLIG